MENLGLGLQISLVGILIVASALGLIPVVVKISEFLVNFYEDRSLVKEEPIKEEKKPIKVEKEKPVEEGITTAKVAAITAVISTYLASEEEDYIITSIKQTDNSWKLSGRRKLLSNQSRTAKSSKKQGFKLDKKDGAKYNSGGVIENA